MATQRTVRTWMAVDAVLVVVLLVLLVGQLAGPGTGRSPGESRGTTTATATGPAPTSSTEPVSFRLPSGNIACTMSPDGVTCTIASITYDPPAVAGCDGDTGHVLVLNSAGFTFDCVTGPAPTVAGSDVPTLEYGSRATSGGYTCTSSTGGVRCTDGVGTGFTLARAAWSRLP